MTQLIASEITTVWNGVHSPIILAKRTLNPAETEVYGLPDSLESICRAAVQSVPSSQSAQWIELASVWYVLVYVDNFEDPEGSAQAVLQAMRNHKLSSAACFLYGRSFEYIRGFYMRCALQNYSFDTYLGPEHPERKKAFLIDTLTFVTDAQGDVSPWTSLVEMSLWSRDLCNEPSNVCTPTWMAEQVQARLSPLGVAVEILDQPALKDLGMRALLGVAKGSSEPPKVVVMRYQSPGMDEAPTVLLGKGVCFDSGGISLKPANNMGDMKDDMAGASVVAATIATLAKNKVAAHVIGIIGLVENMPSGHAQKPGDIVRSLSGQTIEVNNTDAEGRLVLCDLMWYAQEHFKPKCMVDLATLTGAIVVALGNEYAGLFSPNDALAQELVSAGQASGDLVWRMPMCPAFDRLIDAKVADIDNSGPREASSCTAAHFLGRFTNQVPWAHLDIAGVAFLKRPTGKSPIPGATGFGVHLLYHWIALMDRGNY